MTPRLPALDERTAPDQLELIARIRAERGRLLLLYRVLLNSPEVAGGWLGCFTALRQRTTLDARLRELVILRVAALNGAPYEFEAHAPFALAAGVPQDALDELAAGAIPAGLGAVERDALRLADAMTRDIEVPDPLYGTLHAALGDRHMLELTVMVAAYNMVSRVLVALRIGHEH